MKSFFSVFTDKKSPYLHYAQVVFWLGVCFFALRLVMQHVEIITHPFPHTFREAVTPMATDLMLRGGNPYTIDSQPEHAQAYGIMFNLFALPFAAVLGSSLEVHRIVTGVALLGCIFVLIAWMRLYGASLLHGVSAGLILYAAFFYNVLPINRPDSIGLFFMLLSLYVPEKYQYTIKSLFLSALFATLGFYAKSYYILGLGSLFIHLFLFKSPLKALSYAFISLIVFTISGFVVTYFFPLYFYTTFLSFINYALGGDIAWSKKQLLWFFSIQKPLLLYFLVLIGYGIAILIQESNKKTISPKSVLLKGYEKHKHLLLPLQAFVVFSVFFYFLFGKNRGAILIYTFCMILPFLLVMVVATARTAPLVLRTLLSACLLLSIWNTKRTLPALKEQFRQVDASWKGLDRLLEPHEHVLASPAVAPLLYRQGKYVIDQGLNEQFVHAGNIQKEFLKPLFPRYREIQEVSAAFKQKIHTQIRNQEFSIILKTKDFNDWLYTEDDLSPWYEQTDSINVYMPQTGQRFVLNLWKPRADNI